MFKQKGFLGTFSVFSVLLLSSCGYTVNGSNQDVTFTTPGAENTECDVYIEKLRYVVSPPQTLNIMKSSEDMEVRCRAPGNRSKTLTVPAEFSSRVLWGTPAGMAWDYASKSMHYYPSLIAIDFSQEEVKPNPLPNYLDPALPHPDTYDLEEYQPSQPRLNSDRNKKPIPLKRKDDTLTQDKNLEEQPINEPAPLPETDEKGHLTSIIDRLKGEKARTLVDAPTPVEKKIQTVSPAQKTSVKSAEPTVSITPMPTDMPALEDGVSKIAPQSGTPSKDEPVSSKPVKLYPGQ